MGRRKGTLIVVGGHSRHVGKSTVVAAVLRALPAASFIAVKISAHRHRDTDSAPAFSAEETRADDSSPTARFLTAGASRAFLFRAPDDLVPEAARIIESWRAAGRHVIAESNRLVTAADPDVTLFVIDPDIADWKTSSADGLARADALVVVGEGRLPEQARQIGGDRVTSLPVFPRPAGGQGFDQRFRSWLDRQCGLSLAPLVEP